MKHTVMKLLAAATLLSTLALGGCVTDMLTGQGATITPQTAYTARVAFNAIEQTATNYLVTCHANPGNPICANKAKVEAALVPAVRAGRVARNALTACMKAQQAGTGCQSAYQQFVGATSALQGIVAQYRVGS